LARHGRYEIDENSRMYGGFSDVYFATSDDGEQVVLKVARAKGGSRHGTHVVGQPPALGYVDAPVGLPEHRTMTPAEVADVFAMEAETLRRLGGRGFPRLIETLTINDRPTLVMTPIPGTPFDVATARAEDFALLLHRLADLVPYGLAAHGDLKPAHVFVGPDQAVWFIDPGYRSGDLRAVTPEYNPRFAAGPAADAVAVAVMLYERYTGALPPASLDPSADQPSLAAVSPAPRGVAVWVDKLLRDDWSARADPGPPPWASDHRAAATELALYLEQDYLRSPHHLPPRMHIRVMTDYSCYPLWVRTAPEAISDTTDPRDLPLSPSLVGRFEAWAEWYESMLNREDPHDSRDVTPPESAAFEAEGRLLTARLAEELPEACVRYFNDDEPCQDGS
jgi:hypothetical protein